MTATEKTPKTVRLTFPEVEIMKIKKSLKPGEKLSEVLLKKYVEHNTLQDSIARYEKDNKAFEEANESMRKQLNEWVAKCVDFEKREKILQEQTNKLQVENNQLKEKYSEIAPSYEALTEKARKASDAFLSECARHDNTQIELRKTQSEVNRLKDEREKMSQQIATLQADIFAKETFWGKIKNLFA